ncbi:RagB/SusD family nutrient uptake outer membrane protein [Pedobacter arcticus]|uniref:RagB/SusD family nutrient uptake outer membrane protein n=1 Tax=Pedobacter arcticus TaxID=752140 RepID=UPI0002F02C96|nr:RagB/SusD family nutrient uptake outer membrane protein [Pedobacter arcticus]
MMKTNYYKLLFITGVMATLIYSCKSELETVPIEQQTIDYLFNPQDSAGVNANKFLYDIYTHLPLLGNRVGDDYLDAATDDAISSNTTNTSIQQLATGSYSSSNYPDNQWGSYYAGIRQTNIFITNIDAVPLKGSLANGTSFNRVWKAEAKFLRALFYFELLKRYGGIPLLGDKVYQLNDDISLPRNTFEECVNYITNECAAIKDSLRIAPVANNAIERPSNGAALALKSRVLLYAASQLYNGKNVDASNPLTGYAAYDAQRWKKAADAAKDVINLGVYGLLSNFKDVFLVQVNSERIFIRQGGNNTRVENNNGPVGYTTSANNGRTSPTQELVDAFGMANGLPITAPLSGYDATKPYLLRDPRFYATILYNGAPWLSRPVQTYQGGLDKPGGVKQQTRTSYYARKFMGNFETKTTYDNQNHDNILFRYAEILLNFAEASNEYLDSPNQEVYSVVESIRRRAGLVPAELTPGLSKDSMRVIIHNERRKELAFEEHRFYDVRRWKEAEITFNKQIHGNLIYLEASGKLTYQNDPVQKLVFTPKMYFAPIPYSEVVKNKNMVQNPGW